MLVWIGGHRKITAWNEVVSEEEAQQHINDGCLWVSDLEINMPKITETQSVEMYLNEDMTVRYEIISIEEPISEQDQIQAEMLLNQCDMLVNQENQDAVLAEILINQLGV